MGECDIVKCFEWPRVREALCKCSSFTIYIYHEDSPSGCSDSLPHSPSSAPTLTHHLPRSARLSGGRGSARGCCNAAPQEHNVSVDTILTRRRGGVWMRRISDSLISCICGHSLFMCQLSTLVSFTLSIYLSTLHVHEGTHRHTQALTQMHACTCMHAQNRRKKNAMP